MTVKKAMMMKIKAILIDIDGTLVRSDRTISKKTLDAIKKARAEGLIISLCTGRHTATIKTVFDWTGWQGLHIVTGGAQVFNAQDKTFPFKRLISSKDVKWLVGEVESLGGNVVFGHDDYLYGYDDFLKKIAENPWEILAKPLSDLPKDWSSPLVTIHQVNPKVENFLQEQNRLHVVKMATSAGQLYYDVTHEGVTKLTAIREWAKIGNLELSEVAGIGDGMNDFEFLSNIGLPMVVENAVPQLLARFKNVLPSNNDDGVVAGIEKILKSN